MITDLPILQRRIRNERKGAGVPAPFLHAEKEPNCQSGCQKAGQICREGGGDGVAGSGNSGRTEIDGDGIERGFGASQHDGCDSAFVTVRAVGQNQIAGNR